MPFCVLPVGRSIHPIKPRLPSAVVRPRPALGAKNRLGLLGNGRAWMWRGCKRIPGGIHSPVGGSYLFNFLEDILGYVWLFAADFGSLD